MSKPLYFELVGNMNASKDLHKQPCIYMIYMVQLPQISSKQVHEHVTDGLYPEQFQCVSSCFIFCHPLTLSEVSVFTDILSAIKLELTSKSPRRLCSMPLRALIATYLADRDTRPWDMASKTHLTLQFIHLYLIERDLAYSCHVQKSSCLLCQ